MKVVEVKDIPPAANDDCENIPVIDAVLLRQLELRRAPGGPVFQVYHVETDEEIAMLTRNAKLFGMEHVTVQGKITLEETAPGWRDSHGWATYKQQWRAGKYA